MFLKVHPVGETNHAFVATETTEEEDEEEQQTTEGTMVVYENTDISVPETTPTSIPLVSLTAYVRKNKPAGFKKEFEVIKFIIFVIFSFSNRGVLICRLFKI